MKWIGILLVSPLWGGVSTQLFLQAWLAVVNFLVGLGDFIRGAVPRKDTALMMGVALSQILLFSILLDAGVWLLTKKLHFGYTKAENVVYWIAAAISALYMLPQVPRKIRKSWRNAMLPGSLDLDILKRNAGLDPERE